MTKGSRFSDQFWYDIPMYPFSQTPDGRIVGEIHRGREEQRKLQERLISVQDRTANELARIHGGNVTIERSSLNMDETAKALGLLTEQVRQNYANESSSGSGVDMGRLSELTQEGMERVHRDLGSLKGPAPQKKVLDEIFEDGQDIFGLMSMYGKGLLSEKGENDALVVFARPLNRGYEEALREIEQAQFHATGKKTNRDVLDAKNSLESLMRVSYLLSNPQESARKVRGLSEYAERNGCPSLLGWTQKTGAFLQMYVGSQNAQMSETALVELANSGYLAGPLRNRIIELYPEARKDPSLASVNFNLADILRSSNERVKQTNELLEQGREAHVQRDEIIEVSRGASLQRNIMIAQQEIARWQRETLIGQGQTATKQRDVVINQGAVAREQRDELIGIAAYTARQMDELLENEAISVRNQEVALAQQAEALNVSYEMSDQLRNISAASELQVQNGFVMISQLEEMTRLAAGNLREQRSSRRRSEIGISQREIGIMQMGASIQEQARMNYNLRQIIAQIAKSGAGIIDLRELVDIYMGHVLGIMEYHASLAKELTAEVIAAKLAIVVQLKRVEEGISVELREARTRLQQAIEHGNSLLEDVVSLTRDNLANEARQHYEDGKRCLETADNEDDIWDAYEAFQRGIKKIASSAENYFGAGMCAEMLGDLNKAESHYSVAAKRATKEQEELASKAYEAVAKIRYEKKDIEGAIRHSERATERSERNVSARYARIKYLIEAGQIKGLGIEIGKLMQHDEKAFLALINELFFRQIKSGELTDIYDELYDAADEHLKDPFIWSILLEQMFETESCYVDCAFEIVLELNPGVLVERQIWKHPCFEKKREDLKVGFNEIILEQINMFTFDQLYTLLVLIAGCRIPTICKANDVVMAVVGAIEKQEFGFNSYSVTLEEERERFMDGLKKASPSNFDEVKATLKGWIGGVKESEHYFYDNNDGES